MSTLTKVLIVLLALSTFALCATVSVYVATSGNYKDRYNKELTARRAAEQSAESAKRDLNDGLAKSQQREDQLKRDFTAAQTQQRSLQVKIDDLERQRAQLVQEVNGWVSTVEGWTRTKEQQSKLLEEKLAENKRIEEQLIKLQKELDEVSASLLQERAATDDLKKENRLLAEAKVELQKKLDERLVSFGKETSAVPTVTLRKEAVRMMPELTRDIDLRGLIIQVDMANSLASISLGKADGVRPGMKFFATRGEQFICEILITDVDTEESVGIVSRSRMLYEPKVGDSVSTNI